MQTILVALLVASGCATASVGDGAVTYMPVGSGAYIEPVTVDGRIRLDITSATGIDEVQFWLSSSADVTDLTVRLHLRGLEQLTLQYGETVVQAGISSHGKHYEMQSVTTAGGSAESISPDNPYWIMIEPGYDTEGITTHFDVQLPVAMQTQNETFFRLKWIDFYR